MIPRFLTFFFFLAGGSLILAAKPLPFRPEFFSDKYWRDGKAEVTVFEATEIREGLVRPADVRHIAVRETFSPNSMVKTDDWQTPGAYDVIKLNQIIHVPTGSYEFFQMHSSFWPVETGQLIKCSLASIDSCGNSYKEARIEGGKASYIAHTYWEGMDRREQRLNLPENVLFYDELPLKLRSLDWQKAKEFKAMLIPSVIGSKVDQLSPQEALFAVKQAPGAPEFEVTVTTPNAKQTFRFDQQFPHLLREWHRADGSTLLLKSSVRIPYWELSKPGDEKYLK